MVCFGWILSWASAYRGMGIAATILLLSCAFVFRKSFSKLDPENKGELLKDLVFPPFLIVLILIILAGSLYITAVLDSLSYRIPRMLMWLQEGKVHFIDNPDFRMNFMSPFWEFVSTPLYQVTGLRFLWIGSAISWCLLYLAFVFLAERAGVERSKLRWIALIPTASVGFVLQAASTMNDAWAAALLAISLCFLIAFEKERRFWDMVASGLALALAANGKAHFAVLALPWLLWFFFSRNKPLHSVKWAWTIPVALLVLLCSPLPTFVSNHIQYGSFKGQAGDVGFGLGGPLLNLILGSGMMIWQIFQPPINPFARTLEAWNDSWIQASGIAELAPRFGLSARELATVDSASLGLIVGVVLCLGLLRAVRNWRAVARWQWFAASAGLAGFFIAVSQVVPGTLGRSFLGLLVLLIPLSMTGLASLPRKWIVISGTLASATAAASLIFSPAHPLWPAKTVIRSSPRLSASLGKYLAFQERGTAGRSLVDKIPANTREIGVLANGDQSLASLWNKGQNQPRVRFFPASITAADLFADGPECILLIGVSEDPSLKPYGAVMDDLLRNPSYSVVAQESYTSMLERGPEPWILIHRRH